MALTAKALGGGQVSKGSRGLCGPRPFNLHKKEQGRGVLHALRLWGTHVQCAVSKTPMCPLLASRMLLPKKLFLHSPSLPTPDSYPLWDPRGALSPLIQVASTTALTTTDYTPFRALLGLSGPCP